MHTSSIAGGERQACKNARTSPQPGHHPRGASPLRPECDPPSAASELHPVAFSRRELPVCTEDGVQVEEAAREVIVDGSPRDGVRCRQTRCHVCEGRRCDNGPVVLGESVSTQAGVAPRPEGGWCRRSLSLLVELGLPPFHVALASLVVPRSSLLAVVRICRGPQRLEVVLRQDWPVATSALCVHDLHRVPAP